MKRLIPLFLLAATAFFVLQSMNGTPQAEETQVAEFEEPIIDWETRASMEVNYSADDLAPYLETFSINFEENPITLADLVYAQKLEETLPQPADTYQADQIPWDRVGQLAGFADIDFLRAAYIQASIPRNRTGYPATAEEISNGQSAIYPWNMVAAVSGGETNTEAWQNVNPAVVGPWGAYDGWARAEISFPLSDEQRAEGYTITEFARRCRLGLEIIAASPDVQAQWPGLTGQQIKTSSACAVGKTQVLASHFTPGGIYAGMAVHNVWTDKSVISEVTLIHLIGRGSQTCGGKSWFVTKNVETSICSYNPGAWGVAKYDWYFDVLRTTSANLDAALIQVIADTLQNPEKGMGPPCRGCTAGSVGNGFQTYPYTASMIRLGLAGTLHHGWDFPGNVVAIASMPGKVIRAEWTDSSGFVIYIQSQTHPEFVTWNLHLNEATCKVKLGDIVTMGQELCTANGSGYYSDGAHLHFQVNKIPSGVGLFNTNYFVDPGLYIDWALGQ